MNIIIILALCLYKIFGILGFVYLIRIEHPYMAMLVLLVTLGASASYKVSE